MSNAERQRRFRKRNPGYYARIQARKRASAKRGGVLHLAALARELAADADPQKRAAAELFRAGLPAWALELAEAAPAMQAKPAMLLLPAPAEPLPVAGIDAIPAPAKPTQG